MMWPSLVLLVAAAMPLSALSANVCFLLYQMADTNLENLIMDDLREFTESSLIKTPTVTTWVYFDHRNYGTSVDSHEQHHNDDGMHSEAGDIIEPMSFVYNKDGSSQTGEKPQGSFYFKQDHSLGKLVIEEDLGELDGDSPETVLNFVNHALADCIANGAEEYMIVFSSHGGGFEGFGSDDHPGRLLYQTNSDITGALRSALDSNLGEDYKFDVIGFDACLMQSFDAADDYSAVGQYYLASEQVEPGHGWWYQDAPEMSTTLEIANYFQSSFLTHETPSMILLGVPVFPYHAAPKTLSIVDLNTFESSFLVAWEALSKELTNLLINGDPEIEIKLGRARSQAYAFQLGHDLGTKEASSVDMYDFMETFKSQCPAGSETALGAALEDAMTAYTQMFIATGYGEGTSSRLTGMAVLWPTKANYVAYQDYFDPVLFFNDQFATKRAPEWLNFLKEYYFTTAATTGGTSVCPGNSDTSVATETNQLMINPTVGNSASNSHAISTEIARTVDLVLIEFGVDLTPILSSVRFRHLRKSARRLKALPKLVDSSKNVRDSYFRHRHGMMPASPTRRRLQEGSEEYLYAYGGDVMGSFSSNTYEATWDRQFYLMADEIDTALGFYVYDLGEGVKEAPVLYFSSEYPITSEYVEFVDIDDALANGGQYGYLSFSTSGTDAVSSLSLFALADSGNSIAEVSKTYVGQIVPVVLCLGMVDGIEYTELLGGFEGSWFFWDDSLTIEPVDASYYFGEELTELTGGVQLQYQTIDMKAYDEDTGGYSVALFDIDEFGITTNIYSADIPGLGSIMTTPPTADGDQTTSTSTEDGDTPSLTTTPTPVPSAVDGDTPSSTAPSLIKSITGFTFTFIVAVSLVVISIV